MYGQLIFNEIFFQTLKFIVLRYLIIFTFYFIFFRKRDSKVCPVCKTNTTCLPVHLRKEHSCSQSSSCSAVGQFGLRKRKGESVTDLKENKKYLHYSKICPVDECTRVSKNIGEHLRSKMHGYDSKSDIYKRLVKQAKRFDSSLMPSTVVESPKKKYRLTQKARKGISFDMKYFCTWNEEVFCNLAGNQSVY